MEFKAGRLVEYWDVKTDARRVGILSIIGYRNATLIPIACGKVVIKEIPKDRLVKDLGYSKTRTQDWITRMSVQGKEWEITKGAKLALKRARKSAR